MMVVSCLGNGVIGAAPLCRCHQSQECEYCNFGGEIAGVNVQAEQSDATCTEQRTGLLLLLPSSLAMMLQGIMNKAQFIECCLFSCD